MKRAILPALLLSSTLLGTAMSVTNRPPVRFDKNARTVEIDALSTGLQPDGICEFLLIGAGSGHDYEAAFQTSATATEIAAAFEAIGVPKGSAVDFPAFRYWPKGELLYADVSVAGSNAVPLECFLADVQTKIPHARSGFIYLGGTAGEGGSNRVDQTGPCSIVPCYNEPDSIFDVPYRAPQGQVYERNVASTNAPPTNAVPAVITFRPESRDGKAPVRVREIDFRIHGDFITISGPTNHFQPAGAIQAVDTIRKTFDQTPYLSVSWEDDVTCATLRQAATLLKAIDTEKTGICVDAPPAGFPYYQSWLPNEAWRVREDRFSQPCELRFTEGKPGATLVQIDEEWEEGKLTPNLTPNEFPVSTPDELPALLKAHAPANLQVLFLFVPGSAPYGSIRPYIDAARASHPIVHIFVD